MPDYKRLVTFGRLQGRGLRPHQKQLIDELLPQMNITLTDKKTNLSDIFGAEKQEYWLEIGFGGGEHTHGQALKNPDVGYLASEVYINGIASLLGHVDKQPVDNLRVYTDDARELLDTLPDHCLDRVFILFPDPWPKKKHHKRRLISQIFLKELQRILKPNGQLRIATDHVDYAQWIMVQLQEYSGFSWQANRNIDWQTPPDDHITTRYQQKAAQEGRSSSFFQFTPTA